MSTSVIKATTLGGGGTVSEAVVQAVHGFSLGDVVRRSAGAWVLALANVDTNADVLGVVSTVTNANNFIVTFQGKVSGLSGLSDGIVYFLATSSAGAVPTRNVTISEPNLSKPVYIATSATTAILTNQRGLIVSGGGSGSGSGASALIVKDEGVTLTSSASSLDFVGAGVIATNIGNAVTITITGGSGSFGATGSFFQSATQSIVANGLITVAHGLGQKPNLVQLILQNVTGELGYTTGNEVVYGAYYENDFNSGISIEITSTDVVVYTAAGNLFINEKSGIHNLNSITYANWKLIVKAWGDVAGGSGIGDVVHIQHKAPFTGSVTLLSIPGSTWTTKLLNTESFDGGNHATLAANQITLDAGTWVAWIAGSFHSAGTEYAAMRLRNITDSTTIDIVGVNAAINPQVLHSRFVLASAKVLEVQIFTDSATSIAFSVADPGEPSVFTDVLFIKDQ